MQLVRVRLCRKENAGCELAPVEILNELKKFRNLDFNKLNLEEIHVDLGNIDEANHLIFENSKELFEMNDRVIFVGGDDSINYSLIRGFDKSVGGMVVIFSADTNCLEGEWIRLLVENGFFGRRLVLVGCRNVSSEERKFIKQEGISLIDEAVLREDFDGVCDIVMERLNDSSGFYIGVDASVMDPAFVPGACNLVSGGLSIVDLNYFFGRIKLLRNFRGAGIVGINPLKDLNNISIKAGASLISRMILSSI